MNREEIGQMVALAQSRELDLQTARRLVKLSADGIDLALAENPRTPAGILRTIIRRRNVAVLAAILCRAELSEEMLLQVWHLPEHGKAGQWFLRRRVLPKALLFEMAQDAKAFYGEALAKRSDLPEEILVNLSRVGEAEKLLTKRNAGRNIRLPEWRMVEMAESDNQHDRSAVAGNSALPAKWRTMLARDLVPGVRMGVANNSSVSFEEQVRLGYDAYSTVAESVLDLADLDERIPWMLAALPVRDNEGRDALRKKLLALAEKNHDEKLARWVRRREGKSLVTRGGLSQQWNTVTREWKCRTPEKVTQLRSLRLDYDVRLMGWWEPGFSHPDGEAWWVVTQEKHPYEKTRTGWMVTENDFDGLLMPLACAVSHQADAGKTEGRGPSFYGEFNCFQGRWEMQKNGDEVKLVSRLMVVEAGEAPPLVNLRLSYGAPLGPYVARGLLLSEEHSLHVLWETPSGEAVGWQGVSTWEEAKEIERSGLAKPEALPIKLEVWERFEKTLRNMDNQREI